jgi:hypothetical protein
MLRHPPKREDAFHFAEIAKIPEDQLSRFSDQLTISLYWARQNHQWDIGAALNRPKRVSQFSRIRKKAAALLAEMENLHGTTRHHLAGYALWYELFKPMSPNADEEGRFQLMDIFEQVDVQRGHSKIDSYQTAIGELLFVASVEEWPKGLKGGAPSNSFEHPNNPDVSAYDHFVFSLVRTIESCGGKATISVSEAKGYGTLISLLSALRARGYLPNGFIPAFGQNAAGTIDGWDRVKYLRDVARGKRIARRVQKR